MADVVSAGGHNSDSKLSTSDMARLGKWRQLMASFIVTLGIFGLGTVLAWTSPALPNIESTGDLGDITYEQRAWIGSSAMLGALIACPFAGYGVEKFGRKNLMIILTIPFIIGWCLIPMSHVTTVYAGRFITGFATGGFSLAVPIFISEIAEDHIRGLLSSLFQLMMVIGILFTYIVGTFVSWYTLAYVACAVPGAVLLLIHIVPESPRYYLGKGRLHEAVKSLTWYRGVTDPEMVEEEFLRIRLSVETKKSEKISVREIFSRSILQPVFISLSLMIFEQLSGFNAIIFYTVDIFRASGSHIDSHLSTVIVGVVLVVATIVSSFLVDRAGRRFLLIFSEIFMTLSLLALGVFFYMDSLHDGHSPKGFGWIPIVCLVIFIVAFAQGIGPLPWTMMGEILPLHLKGPCSSVATSLVWLFAFLVTLTYDHLLQALGIYWCFWLYAIICTVGTVVVLLFVPETKGKSLEEIQDLFRIKKTSLETSLERPSGANSQGSQA